MIARHLAGVLKRSAQEYPVVTMTGPRQSGKTTLARSVFAKHAYVSLENPDDRQFAIEDPRGFLNRFERGAILDEVQRAPDLFSYLQEVVDQEDVPGKFVLTGSQNFLLLERVSQSLAGRTAIHYLLPFSQSEIEGRRPMSPEDLGKKVPKTQAPRRSLFETLFTGFYPRIHDKSLDPRTWLRNYYRTYVERDVRSLVNVGDIEVFGRFIRLCAGRSGQLLNLSAIASDCGVSHATARRWLSVLEASHLVYLLRPHHRNFNKRLVKSPKLYFLDSGLLCYLLKIRSPEEIVAHSSRGAVFESFVVSELLKTYLNRGLEPDLFFWRDSTGHEVDALLDRGEELVPIEIKSGETIASDFFRGLEYWRSLAGQGECPAALVFGGEGSHKRGNVIVSSWRDWL